MFTKSHFPDSTSRKAIVKAIKDAGFNPKLITDPPNCIYTTHTHPETKLFVGIKNSMKITVGSNEYLLEPGDQLVVTGNVPHSGVVGRDGCIYYWSEKLMR